MSDPITTPEGVQSHALGIISGLRFSGVDPAQAIDTLADCILALATLAIVQRDEIALLRKVLAQDKPAFMRRMETK